MSLLLRNGARVHGSAGFTLVELLVAMTLFVSLMGITAFAFQRVSHGSEKSLQVLELHNKADALLRYMESDVRNLQQTLAMHLQIKDEPYTLTFMKPVNDTYDRYFHNGSTLSSLNVFKSEPPRLTDTIWVRWSWADGGFSRGQSRINSNAKGESEQWYSATYLPNTKEYIKSVDLDNYLPYGMQNNGITPTPQREYKYFEGSGSTIYPISNKGASDALPAQKIAVYETVDGNYVDGKYSEYFDTQTAPWRVFTPAFPGGDLRHLHTTIECGNQDQIDKAFAVRNQDGQTVNKDRLNVLGCETKNGDGEHIYPSQLLFLFDGVEFLSMQLYKRDGQLIDSVADESNTLDDGTDSFDISGVDPVSGAGFEKRPACLRLSYLLHSVDLKERDDEDYDGDGDYDEALSAALRSVANAEGATRLEKIHAFQKHARHFGFASIYINQSIQLGL